MTLKLVLELLWDFTKWRCVCPGKATPSRESNLNKSLVMLPCKLRARGNRESHYIQLRIVALISSNLYITSPWTFPVSFSQIFFVPLVLLRYNRRITLYKFKVCNGWFGAHIYCKMFTIIKLVNTSLTSHNYHLVVLVRAFKIYSSSNS